MDDRCGANYGTFMRRNTIQTRKRQARRQRRRERRERRRPAGALASPSAGALGPLYPGDFDGFLTHVERIAHPGDRLQVLLDEDEVPFYAILWCADDEPPAS